MGIAIFRTVDSGQTFVHEVCPSWVDGKCACKRNDDGTLSQTHPSHKFGAAPPAKGETREKWMRRSALEALRLAQPPAQAGAEIVTTLVGLGIEGLIAVDIGG